MYKIILWSPHTFTFKLRKLSRRRGQSHLMPQLKSAQSSTSCCLAVKPVLQLRKFKGYETNFKDRNPQIRLLGKVIEEDVG